MTKYSDLTFLKSFANNDSAKINKYVGMFLSALPTSLSQMQQQLTAQEWKSLRTSAHSLKSQLKYMGIASGEQLAISIEKIAADENGVDQLPDLIAKLGEITTIASSELKEELAKL